ncbi:MAG: thermonuclease family protein [Patescibacteria group bacterium]
MKQKKISWNKQQLLALGIPMVMIPGILLAVLLGWNPTTFIKTDYYQNKLVFPVSGTVKMVEDGDTFTLQNGMSVRMIGVNAPDRGKPGFEAAKTFLEHEIGNMTVYLEYDRYQDDKYGRILAWVWVDCETTPAILPADYMHLSGNQSRPGLTENPKGCKDGILVNEELVRSGNGEMVTYTDRGKLKYEERIKKGK